MRHDWPAPLLKRLNNSLEHWLRARGIADEKPMPSAHDRRTPPEPRHVGHRDHTALQLISHMVKARMTQKAVPNLDECGRYLQGHILSEEYRHMRERGLRILDVTLGGYRFDPAVEEQIVQQWRTAWHANATGERAHVEQLEVLAMESGRQMALLEHAKKLAGALQSEPTPSIPSALKILLHASHAEILTDERLHGRGTAELASLTELSKWVEAPGD